MNKKQKKVFTRIIVAAVLMVVLSLLPIDGWLKFVLFMIPYLVIGHDILLKAWKGILNRQVFDENFLMAVATIGAILLGDYKEGFAGVDPNYGAGAGGGAYGAGGFDFGDLGDIFGSFFGGGFGGARANPNAPQRGESLRTSVNISFEEAAFGCEKEVSIDRIEQCPDCRGSGCAKGTTAEVCPDCRGSGVIQQRRQTPLGYMSTSAPCQRCGGKGKIIHQPCPKCGGKGMIRHRKTIKVSIPAGIDNGQTISLRAQGNAGKNGGPAGDLLIVVSVRPHEIFRREGTSVLCEAPITFTQAVLGAELEIPTIDGKVKYTIPEGTQSGTTFRLKGKGIPGLNGRGRGDQYVTVYIETPRNLNREQKEALKKFSESLGEKNYEEHKSFFGKFKL